MVLIGIQLVGLLDVKLASATRFFDEGGFRAGQPGGETASGRAFLAAHDAANPCSAT